MQKRFTVNMFRKLAAADEALLRAVMPRTAAACPEPLPRFAPVAPVAALQGTRLVRPLTYTMSEVR